MKYRSSYYLHSGIPLGGIGTGSVEIRPDGRFYEWHIFNNGPWALRPADKGKEFMTPQDFYFVLRVKKGSEIIVRFLQAYRGYRQLTSPRPEEDMPWHTYAGDPYIQPWLKSVEEIEYTGEPPLAILRYIDSKLPVSVKLEALSPFIPGDSDSSSTPVAIFVFRIENETSEEVELSLLVGMKSPFSAEAGKTRIYATKVGKLTAITMQGVGIGEQSPLYGGDITLGMFGDNLTIGYLLGAPYEISFFRNMWVRYRATGILEDNTNEKVHEGIVHGILVGKTKLKPRESTRLVVVLAWFFPNLYDELGEYLGHYYENRFKNSLEVAAYAHENFDYVYHYTKMFHDVLYGTNLDYWLIDLIASQITTFQKSTIYTKDGLFGIWEGYGCCGLNTTDVAFYSSIVILLLFPDLEKTWIKYHARWQLTRDTWPYYELYVLAFPENVVKLKEALLKDPSIAFNLEGFRNTVKEIATSTGKDPEGRIPHFFMGSFKRPDTYDRVDMIPEYILMAVRDAIWTGDKTLLLELWSVFKKAVSSVLKQHDPLGDHLVYHYSPAGYEAYWEGIGKYVSRFFYGHPQYHNVMSVLGSGYTFIPISVQTFDMWSFLGYSSFVNILWLSALKAISEVAEITGDKEWGLRIRDIVDTAKVKLDSYLWNGEYYDLWYDPISGKRDHGILSAQLSGQAYLSLLLNMDFLIERDKVLKALKSIYKYNFIEDEGLINGSYPDYPRPSLSGDTVLPNETGLPYTIGSHMDTPWTGVEFFIAAHMIHEGMIEEALNILKSIHERYGKYCEYWNHVECGSHYYRAMSSIIVLVAIEGLFYNGFNHKLVFKPKLNKDHFKGPLLLPNAWGTIEQEALDKVQKLSIYLAKGSIKLRSISIEIPRSSVKSVDLVLNGERKSELVEAFFVVDKNTLTIEFKEELVLTSGEKAEIVVHFC